MQPIQEGHWDLFVSLSASGDPGQEELRLRDLSEKPRISAAFWADGCDGDTVSPRCPGNFEESLCRPVARSTSSVWERPGSTRGSRGSREIGQRPAGGSRWGITSS